MQLASPSLCWFPVWGCLCFQATLRKLPAQIWTQPEGCEPRGNFYHLRVQPEVIWVVQPPLPIVSTSTRHDQIESSVISQKFFSYHLADEALGTHSFFIVQLSHPYMTTGKTIALTRWTFVDKVMSLLFKMFSRLVIAFLPRSKHLLISWLQSSCTVILEPKKITTRCFHCFPIYLPWSAGTGCHGLSFLNVEF